MIFGKKWKTEENERKARALAKFLIDCYSRCPDRNISTYLPIHYMNFSPCPYSLSLLNQSGIDAPFLEFWKDQDYRG